MNESNENVRINQLHLGLYLLEIDRFKYIGNILSIIDLCQERVLIIIRSLRHRQCHGHDKLSKCCFQFYIYLFIYRGFTPLSTLFQLYHGDSSLIHDPWVNKPVLG